MIALLAVLLAAPLTLRCDDADVEEVLNEVYAQAKVAVGLDDEFRGKRITLDAEEWQLVEVLEEIAKRAGGALYREPDGVYRILPAWKRTFLKRLHETKVKLRLDDATPLASVMQTFRELTGVPVVLDPGRGKEWPEMELRADDVTGAQFLDLALAPHELTWDLRYGVVFVSTRARLAELPARLDLPGAPDKRIGLNLEGVAWPQAAQVPTLMAGLKVEGDLPQEGTVTLHVPSIEVRHALELLFVPHGLDVEMKGRNVILRRRVPPTPYPEGFPQLKKEAEAIDRGRRLKSKEDLAARSAEAIERLEDAFAGRYDRPEAGWYVLYLAEWYALRGEHGDAEGRKLALDCLRTIERSLDASDPKERHKLEALRAARERLEAASK